VDAVNGDDFNPGTQDLPLKSLTLAIDAVDEGGTVHVAPGTYNVSDYWIAKSVHLLGAQAGVKAHERQGTPISQESTLTGGGWLYVWTGDIDVAIDGFRFNSIGVWAEVGTSTVAFRNNRFAGSATFRVPPGEPAEVHHRGQPVRRPRV